MLSIDPEVEIILIHSIIETVFCYIIIYFISLILIQSYDKDIVISTLQMR